MNTIEAINELDAQIKAENLEVHAYTLFRKSIQVVLLSGMPSHSILARGIAILSPTEEPSEEGILWAAQRALDAYKTHSSSLPIIPKRSRGKALFPKLLQARNAICHNDHAYIPVCKSEYTPVLPWHGKARRIESRIIEKLNRQSWGFDPK